MSRVLRLLIRRESPSRPPRVHIGECDRGRHTPQSVGEHQTEGVKSLFIDGLTG